MFDSLCNFRALGGPLYKSFNEYNCYDVNFNPLGVRAYRCARPDHLTTDDLSLLQSRLEVK